MKKIILMGRVAAGKTTLTKLLLRLSDIQEGSILVDGQNIANCTQQSLRRQIAYVPQEALLFHRTIAENISYGRPEASREEVTAQTATSSSTTSMGCGSVERCLVMFVTSVVPLRETEIRSGCGWQGSENGFGFDAGVASEICLRGGV